MTNAFGPEVLSVDAGILSNALGSEGCSNRPVERPQICTEPANGKHRADRARCSAPA